MFNNIILSRQPLFLKFYLSLCHRYPAWPLSESYPLPYVLLKLLIISHLILEVVASACKLLRILLFNYNWYCFFLDYFIASSRLLKFSLRKLLSVTPLRALCALTEPHSSHYRASLGPKQAKISLESSHLVQFDLPGVCCSTHQAAAISIILRRL